MASKMRIAPHTTLAFGALAAALAIQCSGAGDGSGGNSIGSGGSAAGSGSDASAGSGGSSASGGTAAVTGFDASGPRDATAEEFFVDDPPPMSCDGGGQPVVPGGTPDCPNDKNLPGCPCTSEGQTAPCWPGYRRNRNRGACADGMATCVRVGEAQLEWGECVGYTGIDPNSFEPLGTTGAAACTCFSGGFWDITNVSPCFITGQGNVVLGAVSTLMTDDAGGAQCPNANTVDFNNPVPPSQPFSTNRLRVDCTGYFKLCFTLKAYASAGASPAATDCVMKEICTEAYYGPTVDQFQALPDLAGWITATAAEKSCAGQFVANGGYAELSVDGETDECDQVNKVFQTLNYCPLKCADPANAQDPECANCSNGAGGPF